MLAQKELNLTSNILHAQENKMRKNSMFQKLGYETRSLVKINYVCKGCTNSNFRHIDVHTYLPTSHQAFRILIAVGLILLLI